MKICKHDPAVLALCKQSMGDILEVKPLHHPLKYLLGFHASTSPYKVITTSNSYKLVVLHKDKERNSERVVKFRKYQECYQSLTETGRLPPIVAKNDSAMIAEWWHGDTLSKKRPQDESEIRALADCVIETYNRMPCIDNKLSLNSLLVKVKELNEEGLIDDHLKNEVTRLIPDIHIPEKLHGGKCFGDVSLPNFIYRNKGEVAYIDTMGCVDNEYMLINMEKITSQLSFDIKEYFYKYVSARVADVTMYKNWSSLVVLLRKIKSKSAHGSGFHALQRRYKSRLFVKKLEKFVTKYI